MKLKTTAYRGRLPSWSRLLTLYSFFLEDDRDPTTGSSPIGVFAIAAFKLWFPGSTKSKVLVPIEFHTFTSSFFNLNQLYQTISNLHFVT